MSTLARRAALRLARAAARLLPRRESGWGEAMRGEVEYIASDRAALAWSLGALRAAAGARIGALLATRPAALALALLVLGQALSVLFAPALIIAWRLHLTEVVEFLGGQLPGDNYRRFVPLMQTMPAWQLVLWLVVGMTLIAVLWRLLGKGRDALALGALAVVLFYAGTFAAWLDRLLDPALAEAYRHAFTFARPNLRRDVLLPLAQQLAPLVLLALLRGREAPVAPHR